MGSGGRDAILGRLRAARLAEEPLPPVRSGARFADPQRQLEAMVLAAGGRFLRLPDRAALDAALPALELWDPERRVVSLVAGVGRPPVGPAPAHPRELADIHVAILPGRFAVAENGSVWVDEEDLGPYRALFVAAQHLVLALGAGEVVHDMHEAYARVGGRGFGCFVAGPSKTADIEGVLVVGAHGARTCTVALLG